VCACIGREMEGCSRKKRLRGLCGEVLRSGRLHFSAADVSVEKTRVFSVVIQVVGSRARWGAKRSRRLSSSSSNSKRVRPTRLQRSRLATVGKPDGVKLAVAEVAVEGGGSPQHHVNTNNNNKQHAATRSSNPTKNQRTVNTQQGDSGSGGASAHRPDVGSGAPRGAAAGGQPPTVSLKQVQDAVEESTSKGGGATARGILLALASVCRMFQVEIVERFVDGVGIERAAVFRSEKWFGVFKEVLRDPLKFIEAYPSLVHRFRQYAKDPFLMQRRDVRIVPRPKDNVHVVYLNGLYVSELLAALSFVKFNNGVHGRTYGDFLLGWFLSHDALMSCDKTIMDNSRQGIPPGFFDAVNTPCHVAAKHASREDRRQYIFNVTGLRAGSMYTEWGWSRSRCSGECQGTAAVSGLWDVAT
jgi:hypothetical protein